jgi:uncharacterized protein YidB (DUF937 family)
MGLLDQVLGGVLGGGGTSSPLGNVLGQLLGGGNAGGTAGGLGGGLGGLLSTLRQGGLGSHVDSWVGTGQNQPVSPDQLQNAFGNEQVNSWASQSGMQPNDFLSQLSQHLPTAVDGMTPQGRLPDEGTASV